MTNEQSSRWLELWLILGYVAGVWLLFTVGFWLLEHRFRNPSLWEVCKAQVEFFRGAE